MAHHEVSTTRVRKAVVPAAGLGTRFIPATKAVPKEMLPVVDKPAIQYVVEEAAAAHLDDVLIVTGRGKGAIADHFHPVPELEAKLESKGDLARLAAVQAAAELAHLSFVRQGEPKGLGHAVLQGKDHVGEEPFAVLLGDDLIDPRETLLADMVAVHEQVGGSVIALMEVEPSQIHLYGCAAVEPVDAGVAGVDVVRVTGMVEKPSAADAPSNLAMIGRYILAPAVFGVLETTPPGRGGEIQLTDALQTLAGMPAEAGGGVHGVVFRGRRYDTGDKLEYLKAVVGLAAEHEDLGADFAAWLETFVRGRRVGLGSDPAARPQR